MVDRMVVLFLKSPLYTFSRTDGSHMPPKVVQVRGKVVREKGPGVWLKVEALGVEGDPIDKMTWSESLPVDELYVPYAKIDCLLPL